MRHFMAITTPQDVINACMRVAEFTTHRRLAPVPHTALDHFGFCVEPSALNQLGPAFMSRLVSPVRLALPEGGTALAGLQAESSKLCWYSRNHLPGLVLSPQPRELIGGGYLWLTANNPEATLDELNRELTEANPERSLRASVNALYGQPCFALAPIGLPQIMEQLTAA
jgi:hypothetical protein